MKVDYKTVYTPTSHHIQKWINDLNIRAKTIKFLEGKIKVNLHDLRFGNEFLDVPPKNMSPKEKNR